MTALCGIITLQIAAIRKDGIMTKNQNLQDIVLNSVRISRQQITVFLVNGFQLRGVVMGFDSFTVVLDSDNKQQLIYKHAISTIVPAHPVTFTVEADSDKR
jgi:host factor-I protein